ncbi:NUDIX domain-containing protein [Nakamurella panacisegetis]|uniref:NUDIX domain-containing protein n=1 Tax=Nakamurella panacisegetis TaxID=1090615 RepID=A0A1H0IPG3_9ACTN|nr:NUDIX hydrolase [Nakamurella panacisegetis]SDO33242.1 NUDIX domain-containing protein [Nakamurella panacisegetis]
MSEVGPKGGLRSRVRSAAYSAFGYLPPRVRRGIVGVVAPSFTVGALGVIHDGDLVLFVRQQHRPGLALPGGLLKKGEPARRALVRELAEELGADASGFAAAPDTAHVDPGKTRVDLIFFCAADRATMALTPAAEVLSFEWRRIDDVELTPQTREILASVGDRIPR